MWHKAEWMGSPNETRHHAKSSDTFWDTGIIQYLFCSLRTWRCPRGVMVKAIDCGIVESEFVLKSRYYVHLRVNALGKDMNLFILPAMG